MIIRRCAWHRPYHGYPMVFGIASWRGLEVSYTDGMCRGCTIRFRRQWNLPGLAEEATLGPALLRGAVTVAVVIALTLTVRSSDSSRSPATTTPLPETVLVPTPLEVAPTLVVPAPRPVRPARLAPPSVRSVAKVVVARPPSKQKPGPSFDGTDTEPFVFVSAVEPDEHVVESDRAYPTRPRFPSRSMFAAVPHAGLTQQTP